MDMSQFNFAPEIPLADTVGSCHADPIAVLAETAINLRNVEFAIDQHLQEHAARLDVDSRAHLARTRDVLSAITHQVHAAIVPESQALSLG